jgi:hypothetical protein
MDTLKDVISDIRVFLYGGVVRLPLVLAGTLLIIGLCTANYAILFFLVGFLMVVPLVSAILDFLIKGLLAFLPDAVTSIFMSSAADICKLVIPFSSSLKNVTEVREEIIVITNWVAMVSFFIGYLLHNALQLYKRDTPNNTITVSSNAKDVTDKVNSRKTQALISIFSILVVGLAVLGLRIYSGCDSVAGMLLTIGGFGVGGYYWYYLLSEVGQDRLSDLFGIANRLLPPSAITNSPIACVPVPV